MRSKDMYFVFFVNNYTRFLYLCKSKVVHAIRMMFRGF